MPPEKVLARSAAVLQKADRVDDDIAKLLWRMACEKEAKQAVAWLDHQMDATYQVFEKLETKDVSAKGRILSTLFASLTMNWQRATKNTRYMFALSEDAGMNDEDGSAGHEIVTDLCRGNHPMAHWPHPCDRLALASPWGEFDYLMED